MRKVFCNYCNKEAVWVNNKEIYGRSYGEKNQMAWWCKDCDAYVGCHQNSKRPLGILANKELRQAKIKAKNLWKEKYLYVYGKGRAYKYLAQKLNIEPKDCHFGMFDLETCNKILKLC